MAFQQGPNGNDAESSNFSSLCLTFSLSENKVDFIRGRQNTTPPSTFPRTSTHTALTPLPGVCRGAGRNVTAITNPVVSVSGTTAATQLTFRLKAHTHAHTSVHTQAHTRAHTHTQTHHISRTFHLKRRQHCSLPFDFMLSPERVHVVGF